MTAGARFGPKAIRAASGRQSPFRSFGPRMAINPYSNWAKLVYPCAMEVNDRSIAGISLSHHCTS